MGREMERGDEAADEDTEDVAVAAAALTTAAEERRCVCGANGFVQTKGVREERRGREGGE